MYIGILLIVVILGSGIITYLQNAKSESIMDGFKNFIPQMCTVIRDGKKQSISALKLVRGDLVVVAEGQRIPADLRIIYSNEMRVDNSSLTGEQKPLIRSEKCDKPDNILETQNVAFFGTLCKHGVGRGVVFNIGDAAVIGQIASLASSEEKVESPLRRELNRFIYMIFSFTLTMGVIVFILGFSLGFGVMINLLYMISIIVCIPEGLMPTITVSLALAAKRLSERQVLVKHLESVETLGSTSCICSDKTGTLTQNVMTVENLWYDLLIKKGKNRERYGPNSNYEYDLNDPSFQLLVKAITLNTAAVFSDNLPDTEVQRLEQVRTKTPEIYERKRLETEAEWVKALQSLPYYQRPVIGDASETALIKFVQPINDVRETREIYRIAQQFDGTEAIIPFNSAHKFALNIFVAPNDAFYSFEVFMKGAPEKIFEKCKYIRVGNGAQALTSDLREQFEIANTQFAKNGERVLGFARLLLRRDEYPNGYGFNLKDPFDLPFEGFEFVGLVSMIDPPKDSVSDAIEKCRTAGIKVIMVTGDQQLTAASIAKKIGIFDGKTSMDLADEEGISNEEAIEFSDAIIVNGDMLTKAAAEDEGLPHSERGKKLEKWLKKSQIVFARTSPAQKLYIVAGCQRLGHIVAVTGDGVNDSPAIHQADIGISMGITGSDVAKEAADMILLDDDFASIVIGVREGRRIFDNLKKVILYLISRTMCELIPFYLPILFGIPVTCNTILIITMALGTDIFPAIGCGYEEPEIDVMTRAPRNPNQRLVQPRLIVIALAQVGVLEGSAGLLGFFITFNEFGFPARNLINLIHRPIFPHNPFDVYSPSHPFLGNTASFCDGPNLRTFIPTNPLAQNRRNNDYGWTTDWTLERHGHQDLRVALLTSNCPTGAREPFEWGTCWNFQISPITNTPVCYTTEAHKYAQSAYFASVVMAQFVNSIARKTKSQSAFNQPLSNPMMVFGWCFQLLLSVLIFYIRPISEIFQARDIKLLQFGFYGAFFAMLVLVHAEIHKLLIRRWPRGKFSDRPNWFERKTLI
jgi:sodium/potassium-transporting ATPase subunit alpha